MSESIQPVNLLVNAVASGDLSQVEAWLSRNTPASHMVVASLNEDTDKSIYEMLFNAFALQKFRDSPYESEVFATFRRSLRQRKPYIALALLRHFPELAPSWDFIKDTQPNSNILHLAAASGFPEVLELLLELVDGRTKDKTEREKILSAADFA